MIAQEVLKMKISTALWPIQPDLMPAISLVLIVRALFISTFFGDLLFNIKYTTKNLKLIYI